MEANLKNFYIAEEQSIYLLSADDAKKLRDWIELCKTQLLKMGYTDVDIIGKGAYGFVFAGKTSAGKERVFKFSRITLPQSVRERLEEEAYMLSLLSHPNIPNYLAYQSIKKQGILVMERGLGLDLHELSRKRGTLPVKTLIEIAIQLADILKYLRSVKVMSATGQLENRPVVHGDIKPSNLVWDEGAQKLSLIDWGSSVFAQLDAAGNPVSNNVMDLMSADLQNTNARLGDVYFIGDDQLNGALSSPRYDEQGAAATLYALASNQICRFGNTAIPPSSLGLPRAFADVLEAMLSKDRHERERAGDRFVEQVGQMKNWYLPHLELLPSEKKLPVYREAEDKAIETVVYSSRKSFLRQQQMSDDALSGVNDAQLEKYYKNYLSGMGDNEKAFVAAVSRLSEFPIVGGLAIHWREDGLYIDSSLKLYHTDSIKCVTESINTIVDLARSLEQRDGIFKSCLFDAKRTLHLSRDSEEEAFVADADVEIGFEINHDDELADTRMQSYFEDGEDPDEKLDLPAEIMVHIYALNKIPHSGCIIFEVLPKHLKIHNNLTLMDASKEAAFRRHLHAIMGKLALIEGLGVSGFMKLPDKDTKRFDYVAQREALYYPADPRAEVGLT